MPITSKSLRPLFAFFLTAALASACGTGDAGTKAQPRQTLAMRDVEVGTGRPARPGDRVVVHYEGWFENGKVFSSSYRRGAPLNPFELGTGFVIEGWEEGLVGMKEGGVRRLDVPPELGYGAEGVPEQGVPPNARLIFDVEMVDIEPGGTRAKMRGL